MKQKRSAKPGTDEVPRKLLKRFSHSNEEETNDGQGTSSMIVEKKEEEELSLQETLDQQYKANREKEARQISALEALHSELIRPEINVQEVGRLVTEGLMEGSLTDTDLKDMSSVVLKNFLSLGNIDIFDLSNALNRGSIDSRHVVIGNAFLWNILKSEIGNVREKFDNYSFKMNTMSEGFRSKLDMNSGNLRSEVFIVMSEGLFEEVDLLEVFKSITFRKSADIVKKAKQIIKTYLSRATSPKCAIWHYGLRLSGCSHKKTIYDIPTNVVKVVLDFLLALVGLGQKELEHEFDELDTESLFYEHLGETEEQREREFSELKTSRSDLLGKFRICLAEALNEVREMPFNITTRLLQPPPRGKTISGCVTWKQYEEAIKKCVENPSKENIKAKEQIEVQLEYDIEPIVSKDDDEDEDERIIVQSKKPIKYLRSQ